jgi:monothiol glutaredoxin
MSDAIDRIRNIVEKNRIVIFMKGNRHFPQCGFSAATIEVLQSLGAPFETVDVLQDMEIREGVKQFTKWPTIPQVFIDGKFIGGCDIVREMYEAGELQPLVQQAAAS